MSFNETFGTDAGRGVTPRLFLLPAGFPCQNSVMFMGRIPSIFNAAI